MNTKQKYTILTAAGLILVSVIWWFVQGGEFFTKTRILVDNSTELDRMLGVENKQYADKFILGLIPSGYPLSAEFISVATLTVLIILLSGILIYSLRTKRKRNEK